MALDQFALLEVLEALKSADVSTRIRTASQTIYQALIDADLTAVIGRAMGTKRESPGPAKRLSAPHAYHHRWGSAGSAIIFGVGPACGSIATRSSLITFALFKFEPRNASTRSMRGSLIA